MVSVALLRGLLIFCGGCSIGVLISFWNYGVNTIVTWRRIREFYGRRRPLRRQAPSLRLGMQHE